MAPCLVSLETPMVAALCPVPPLPHSPGPWPWAPLGGMVPGWQNHPGSWPDRDSIVTLCSLCCLWRKVVLIPFHPLSMAVSCLQAWGRPVSEIGAIVWSLLSHVLIHPSCCPGPFCWLARPLPVASSPATAPPLPAAPPSLLFWATAGQAWDASAKSPGRKRGGEEG